jgi:5'(3')-deoxyribonucleotidase
MNIEIDALIAARELNIEQIETLTRVMFGKDPSLYPSDILKRDILVYAKSEPSEFLNILNDPQLQYQSKVRLFFENKLLALRNNDREIWFNTSTNKKKMISVPFGEDPYEMAGHYLQSDEGLDALKMLEAIIGE